LDYFQKVYVPVVLVGAKWEGERSVAIVYESKRGDTQVAHYGGGLLQWSEPEAHSTYINGQGGHRRIWSGLAREMLMM